MVQLIMEIHLFLSDTIDGLDWLYENRYNTTVEYYGNLFDWQIGIPLYLVDAVILLYNHLTFTQIDNYMDSVDRFAPNADTYNNKPATGANRAWLAKIVAVRGIIVKDADKLQIASDALDELFLYISRPTEGGFLTDGTYIQHNCYTYAGGYGQNALSSVTEYYGFWAAQHGRIMTKQGKCLQLGI